MNEKKIRWISIGDSFTYLNNHLDETGYRVTKGYLDCAMEELSNQGRSDIELFNIGINGSVTGAWLAVNVPKADLYTILLGTNDWHCGVPLGTVTDFAERNSDSILGNLGILINRLQNTAPQAKILVMNPVERGDFVYILDAENNAPNSSLPENGVYLSEVSAAIYAACLQTGIPCMNLHDDCGFTPANAVRFKHVKTENGYADLPWPEYTAYAFDPEDEYPYPPEASDMTYDGLHPSDKGNVIIGHLLAEKIKELLEG